LAKEDLSIRELLKDSSFRSYCEGKARQDEIIKWDNWIEEDEKNRKKAKEAKSLIIGFSLDLNADVEIDDEWERLKTITIGDNSKNINKQVRTAGSFPWKNIFRIAAVLLVGAILGSVIYLSMPFSGEKGFFEGHEKVKTVRTETGENKTINFKNGTQIVLNSNTTLSYSQVQSDQNAIKISMDGQAYYISESKSKQSTFIVKTPDGLIKDIGTKFLVSTEEDFSRVVVQEGRVKIITRNHSNKSKGTNSGAGKMIEFNKSEVLLDKMVNASFYTSWATESIRFDETTLAEFAEFIRKRFEVNVKIQDSTISDVRIDGGIYFRSLEDLLESVSEVANVPLNQSKNGRIIYIGNKTR